MLKLSDLKKCSTMSGGANHLSVGGQHQEQDSRKLGCPYA